MMMAHLTRPLWGLTALAALALVACGEDAALPSAPDADGGLVDTSQPAEVITGAPDGGAGVAEDGVEDGAEEVAIVVVELPDHLQGGFVDLTEGLEDWPPFEVFAGVPSERLWPDVTHGLFVDLDGDEAPEVILSGVAHEALVRRQIYRYEEGALVPYESDPLNLGAVVAADDLDGDGHTDLLVVRITSGEHTAEFVKGQGIVPSKTNGKPAVWVMSLLRARDHLTGASLSHLMDQLIDGYGK